MTKPVKLYQCCFKNNGKCMYQSEHDDVTCVVTLTNLHYDYVHIHMLG